MIPTPLNKLNAVLDLHTGTGLPSISITMPVEEWKELSALAGKGAEYADRLAPYLTEPVPMAAIPHLLNAYQQCVASTYRPDVKKAKKLLVEISGRVMASILKLGAD